MYVSVLNIPYDQQVQTLLGYEDYSFNNKGISVSMEQKGKQLRIEIEALSLHHMKVGFMAVHKSLALIDMVRNEVKKNG